ncbi:hypothetical protein [Polaribacter sp.]|uniref:hypothetical protein n=1 Tax=Polaribacter sp. TaxID=1920175 RepID=UPI003EF78DC2
MKNIKFIAFFFGLILLWSCNDDQYKDYTAPNELSDVSWLISFDQFAQNKTWLNQDTSLSFFDLSQGTTSHEWSIEQGNNFLKEGFSPKGDSLFKFINESAGLSIDKAKAHVLFANSGINKVRLLNKFNAPVTYRSSTGIKTSVKEGEFYVIDTTFIFDVYAHLQPAFRVLKGTDEVLNVAATDMPNIADESTWPVVEIEAATALTFEDLTTIGRPNGRSWFAEDGVPSQTGGLIANIKFYKLGTFNVGSFRSLRLNELPRETIDKLIPLKVKVVKSSQPFVYDGALTENEEEVISFRVNGEVSEIAGEAANFTVNVTNTAAGFGPTTISVASASINPTDATFINLQLSAPIYNSDVVSISYNSSGNLKSADERVLESFTDKIVQMHYGNSVLPAKGHASYEEANPSSNNAYAQSYFVGANNNKSDGGLVYERITSKFSPSDGGSASMKYSTLASDPLPNANLWSFGMAVDPIPEGTYRMSYMIWIDPSTTLKTFRTEWNKPDFTRQVWDIENVEKGKWVKITNTFSTKEIPTSVRHTFRPHHLENVGVSGAQLLWVDDFQLVVIEERI